MWIKVHVVVPRYNEVQQFLGLVQYLAHFMPDITTLQGHYPAVVKYISI